MFPPKVYFQKTAGASQLCRHCCWDPFGKWPWDRVKKLLERGSRGRGYLYTCSWIQTQDLKRWRSPCEYSTFSLWIWVITLHVEKNWISLRNLWLPFLWNYECVIQVSSCPKPMIVMPIFLYFYQVLIYIPIKKKILCIIIHHCKFFFRTGKDIWKHWKPRCLTTKNTNYIFSKTVLIIQYSFI